MPFGYPQFVINIFNQKCLNKNSLVNQSFYYSMLSYMVPFDRKTLFLFRDKLLGKPIKSPTTKQRQSLSLIHKGYKFRVAELFAIYNCKQDWIPLLHPSSRRQPSSWNKWPHPDAYSAKSGLHHRLLQIVQYSITAHILITVIVCNILGTPIIPSHGSSKRLVARIPTDPLVTYHYNPLTHWDYYEQVF